MPTPDWNTRRQRRERARELRKQMTDAELRLWAGLRWPGFEGMRFRRQMATGPYVVDFVCLACRLVIEVDGDSHGRSVEADRERTLWLEGQGFRVIRFTNDQVYDSLEAVLGEIRRQCRL